MAAPEEEETRTVGNVDVVLVRNDVDDAADGAKRSERRDERVDAQARDHETVEKTYDKAGSGSEEGRCNRAGTGVAERDCGDHSAEAEHGSDRDVDSACEDHQRLAEGYDTDRRGLLQDVDAVGER